MMSPMLTSGYFGMRLMGLIVRCWWLGLDLYVDLLRTMHGPRED